MKISLTRKARTKTRKQKDHALNILLLKIAIIIFTTAVIVYFLPRTSGFNYSYELNQPWHYGTMISTQKFNIQMSDSTLELKHDSIARSFMPYFNRNTDTENIVRNRLEALECGHHMKQHIIEMFDSVYQHGVMGRADYDSLKAVGTTHIRIIQDNHASVVPIEQVITLHEAYRFIVHHDEQAYPASEISRLNINAILTENLQYEPMKSGEELRGEYNAVTSDMGFVRVNEKIVDRGELVTEEIYQKLKSYEAVLKKQQNDSETSAMLIWGQVAIVAFIISMMIAYLSVFRPDYLENKRCAILLFSLVTLFSVIASWMVTRHILHVFILPCCMAPIIIRVFMDSRTALTFHVCMVLVISLALTNQYEFIIFQIITGFMVILNLRELNQRSQIIHTAIIATVTYCAVYTAYEFAAGAVVSDLDRRIFIYFCINGLLLLFTYPLFWVMEKVFGFISDVTLIELSNINNPLLQKMSEEAPGTFQHSMQVANLASEVAKRIGANPQLVRTGALYHDIGKLERPVFFTENQAGSNPHKYLSPTKSAEVIISHVTNGLALAEKNNLPEQIKGFIRTHHGLGKTKYFLITYKNEHPDEEVDESKFQYPGPNPQTKEQAILMMADAVEAASRSLKEYTEEAISNMVETIVDGQVKEGFLKECPITFKDITDAKEIFKERLKTIYHTRISYPELNKNTGTDNKKAANQLH